MKITEIQLNITVDDDKIVEMVPSLNIHGKYTLKELSGMALEMAKDEVLKLEKERRENGRPTRIPYLRMIK